MEHDSELGEFVVYEIRGILGTAAGALSSSPQLYDMYQETVLGQIDIPALSRLSESIDLSKLPTDQYVSPWTIRKTRVSSNMGSCTSS